MCENHLDKALTPIEISNTEDLTRVLEPLFLATEELSGEKYPTRALVWPMQCALYDAVKEIFIFL